MKRKDFEAFVRVALAGKNWIWDTDFEFPHVPETGEGYWWRPNGVVKYTADWNDMFHTVHNPKNRK